MQRIIIYFVLSCMLLMPAAVDAKDEIEETILSRCDVIREWNYGAPQGSSFQLTLDTDSARKNNRNSIKAVYDIKDNTRGGGWMFFNISIPYKLFYKFNEIISVSFYLKGDGGTNAIRAGIVDSEGEIFESKQVFVLNKTDWQLMTVTKDELQPGPYQPNKDKLTNSRKLDLPAPREFFFVIDGLWTKSKKGSFSIDDVKFKHKRVEKKGNNIIISVSQTGYKIKDKKIAVIASEKELKSDKFQVFDSNGELVYKGNLRKHPDQWDSKFYTADFSEVASKGIYRIKSNTTESVSFPIRNNIYRKIHSRKEPIYFKDIFNSFMGQQRCYDEKCMSGEEKEHSYSDRVLPAYKVDGKSTDHHIKGKMISNLTGGWHDATSTDKETISHVNSILDMLWAYELNSGIFAGPGQAGIPLIMKEAQWGLDYILKIQDTDGGFYIAVKPHDSWKSQSPPRRILINKGTGVNARASACLAAGYRMFMNVDKKRAEKYLKAAQKGWEWVESNPDKFILGMSILSNCNLVFTRSYLDITWV